MTIQTNRTLGIVGASLTLVGVVGTLLNLFENTLPALNLAVLGISGAIGILAFVGFILFLVAMYGFSRDYGEHRIFNYILYGIIGTIISVVVIGVIWLILVLFSAFSSSSLPTGSSAIQSWLTPYVSPLTLVVSLASLVWVFFNYRAFNLLAEKSRIPLFSSVAKIFVIGALVNIGVGALFAVLGVAGIIDYELLVLATTPGGLVQYIAWGLAVKAFFSIEVPPPPAGTSSTIIPATVQVRYCSKCGAANRLDAVYCSRCGQQLQ